MTMVSRVDAYQRRHRWAGLPLAVLYKFADDQGTYLAAQITYYGLVAVFPLLLLLATILGYALRGNQHLQRQVLDSALAQFPVIGDQITANIHSLHGSAAGLIIGIAGCVYGGRQGIPHQVAHRDHRHVGAFPVHSPDPERYRLQGPGGDVLPHCHDPGWRQDHHRIIAPDRGHKQAVGVCRGGRHDRLDADVGEQAVRLVRMLSGPARPRSRRGNEVGHGDAGLPSCHQGELVRLVGDLLEDEKQQRRNLEFDHRPAPGQRGAGREAGERLLRQRHVHHPLGPEPAHQAAGHVGDTGSDVLPEQADGGIA
jgi:virulence factor BrkB